MPSRVSGRPPPSGRAGAGVSSRSFSTGRPGGTCVVFLLSRIRNVPFRSYAASRVPVPAVRIRHFAPDVLPVGAFRHTRSVTSYSRGVRLARRAAMPTSGRRDCVLPGCRFGARSTSTSRGGRDRSCVSPYPTVAGLSGLPDRVYARNSGTEHALDDVIWSAVVADRHCRVPHEATEPENDKSVDRGGHQRADAVGVSRGR
jgi:hypothetical protein